MFNLRIILIFSVILISVFWGCSGDVTQKSEEVGNKTVDKLDSLMQLAKQQPDNADVFNNLAVYHLIHENFNDALHNVNRSLQLEPGNTKFFVTLSDIYLMMGDAERAQLTLYKALDLEPRNADIYVNIGRLQIYTEDYTRAFENLRKALELNKNNSKAYFWRGMAWLEKQDTAKAISDWQVAVANDPESFDGYYNLGLLMAARKDHFAFDYLDHALRLAPENTELLYDIGMAFQEIERYSKALETYNSILVVDSCNHKALFNIGYIQLVENEEYEDAIRYFSNALKCMPDYADALYNRGLAHEMMMNFDQARKDYKDVLNIVVNHQKAIDGLNRLDQIQQ